MKNLVSVFIVLGLLTPLYAETELLYEDFEGADPGTLINTLSGWSGVDEMVISSTLVDQGQSAGYTGTAWPKVSKAFTPSAAPAHVLTGTLSAPGTAGNYAHVQLKDSTIPAGKARLHVNLGYNELTFGYLLGDGSYGDYVKVPQALTPMDFKAVISGSVFDAYWRLNGESEWTYAGNSTATGLGGVDMVYFDLVELIGHGGLDGGIDTIRLVVEPLTAMVVPGDTNEDGTVDNQDATILGVNWQAMSGATWTMGDFNGDGMVDDKDASIMAANWQAPLEADATVPEPGTMALAFLGAVMLLLLGRKRFA